MTSGAGGRLLFVFAHPDDEAFLAGGTIARHTSEGGRAALVCATRGERGSQPSVPVCPVEALGEVRQRELEDSCNVLGIDHLEVLGYGDRQVDRADFDQATLRIARAMTELRPAAVVTFGPDGISGHPDHVAVHHLTLAAYDRLFGPDSESLNTGGLPRLWFLAPPSAFWRFAAPEGGGPEAVIDISQHLPIKLRALLCHRSQRHNVERVFGAFYDLERFVPRVQAAATGVGLAQGPGIPLVSREYFTLGRGLRPGRRLEESLLEP